MTRRCSQLTQYESRWSSGTLKLEALMCEKKVSESHVEKGVMRLRCMRVCVCAYITLEE